MKKNYTMNITSLKAWIRKEENKEAAYNFLVKNEVPLENLSHLNFKVYGALKSSGFDYIHQIFSIPFEELSSITGLSVSTSEAIYGQINEYLLEYIDEIRNKQKKQNRSTLPTNIIKTDKSAYVENESPKEDSYEDWDDDYEEPDLEDWDDEYEEPDLVAADDEREKPDSNKHYGSVAPTTNNQYVLQDLLQKSEKKDDSIKQFQIDGIVLSVFDALENPNYKEKILKFVEVENITLEDMGLSNRNLNSLHRTGKFYLSDIIFETEESLSKIRNMGRLSVEEILTKISCYLLQNQERIMMFCNTNATVTENVEVDPFSMGICHIYQMPQYKEKVLEFVKANDWELSELDLSVRATNCLQKEGFEYLSDFIFESSVSLSQIRGLGTKVKEEILYCITEYLKKYEKQIIAYLKGDSSSIYSQDVLEEKILNIFKNIAFTGLHYPEILEAANLPEEIDEKIIKKTIGKLIREHQLEYVDFRCYRTYMPFEKFLMNDAVLDDRDKEFVMRKMSGETLEKIAEGNGITRERVRQKIKKAVAKVHQQYLKKHGLTLFDEDYYQHFYTTYDVDKNVCIEWLGIPEKTYYYISMFNNKGSDSLDNAIDDPELDVGFKLKISNYLNRNKICIDGNWIEKKRSCLEDIVLKKFCEDEMSFGEYCEVYNKFLQDSGIPFDDKIYYTKDVVESRYNRLAEARTVLWKQFQMLRYYDIDGQDYSELLDTLNFDGYHNTEISTLKLFRDNSELMRRYDIRDYYELHNLLRKIIPEGSYDRFKCGRMPGITFGEFDRDAALYELLVNNAPISMNDFVDIIHEEFGFDKGTIVGSYITPLKVYYHQGIFRIDQKVMPQKHLETLKLTLEDDFYFIDEVKTIYKRLFDDADVETINPYNLKKMGFMVLSRYVLKNHSSLEAYFTYLLTEKEMIDISLWKKKYCYVQMWSSTLSHMKKSYDIIEFEPNQIIRFSKLEKAGITKQTLKEFCDSVYKFVQANSYFSIKSIRNQGFQSDLFELGFDDWFYANVLCVDDRFSYNSMFGNLILYTGVVPISIASFVTAYVKSVGSIDTYELMNILENEYGCMVNDRNKFMRAIYGNDLYYDTYLQRLYANEELYYRELDNDQEFK